MTLVRTQELLDTAVNSRVGVAAFNVITLEHAEAITAGAEAAAAHAILQVSQNAVKFHGGAVRPLAARSRRLLVRVLWTWLCTWTMSRTSGCCIRRRTRGSAR